MKFLTTLLFLALTGLTAHAQTFVVKESKKIDYNDCQKNQNLFYDKVLAETDSQIEYLISKIEENRNSNIINYASVDKKYQKLLLKMSLKKIILQKLITQFNSRSLSKFMKAEHQRRRDAYDRKGKGLDVDDTELVDQDFIAYENIRIDLDDEVENEIEEMVNDKFHGLKEFAMEEFKTELKKEILKESYHLYTKIAAGVFVQMSKQALRSAIFHIGSSLFISALKGTVVSILTEPLYGARYLPEKNWTDLLEEYNELLLVPDWMKKANVGDGSPWSAHCSAIAHRAMNLERSITSFLEKDNALFMDELGFASLKVNNNSLFKEGTKKSIDSTYVKRLVIPLYNAKRVH